MNETIEIRDASKEELKAFYLSAEEELANLSFCPTQLTDPAHLRNCDFCLVAAKGDTIVGAIALQTEANDGSPSLDMVYVRLTHRREGIGRKLCIEAVRRFIEMELTPIQVKIVTKEMVQLCKHLPDEIRHAMVKCVALDPRLQEVQH